MTILTFNGVEFQPVKQQNQIWLTSGELAIALGYAETDSVTKLYNRHIDEFTSSMTQVIDFSETVNLTVPRSQQNLVKKIRIFNLRGCHLVGMFAKTKVAKDFRKWVLDILDKEVSEPTIITDTLSTKEERKPLVKAVNMLVDKSNLNYDEAWHLVHQYFNIKSVNELKSYQIKEAVAYIHGLIVANAQKTNQSKIDDRLLYETLSRAASHLKDYQKTMFIAKELMFADREYAGNKWYFLKDCIDLIIKLSKQMDLRNELDRPMFEERKLNFYRGYSVNW
ncbi:MAG: BRO-N domain-containing protein [Moraxella sp.]